MSTRSSAEHRATYQSHSDDDDSAQLEHAVEDKLDHKTQHRVEVNGDSKSNEFLTKFNSELRGIDDRAASVFDPKGSIADYSADDRKSFVNAYITAFNNTAPEDLTEKWEAAKDTSNMIFKPLYEEIELKEAQAHLNFSPEVLEVLDQNDIKVISYVTNTPGPDGKIADYSDIKEIEFTVDSIEQARKIMEDSNGAAYIADPSALDHRKEEFAVLLYASAADTDTAANYLDKTLTEAIAYTNMESHSAPEPTDFTILANQQDEQILYAIVGSNLKSQATETRKAIDELSYSKHPDAAGAQTASDAFFDTYQEAIMLSIAQGDQDSFTDISSKFNEFNESFAQAIQHEEGFVKSEDYTQPDLKEQFDTPDEALNYISEVQDVLASLDHRKGDISQENYYTLDKMSSEFWSQLEFIRQSQEEQQLEKDDEDYNLLHRIAKGINYLLKPFNRGDAPTSERPGEPALSPA